ncbi:hypothetical protein E4U26_000624 [Claviceps purpurea]|nr:hypothetical protein E4U26_000624 [Claviceps purpurea]
MIAAETLRIYHLMLSAVYDHAPGIAGRLITVTQWLLQLFGTFGLKIKVRSTAFVTIIIFRSRDPGLEEDEYEFLCKSNGHCSSKWPIPTIIRYLDGSSGICRYSKAEAWTLKSESSSLVPPDLLYTIHVYFVRAAHIMKISILITSLLSLGASALPEAEESITVGEYTYTGGDLPKGELKVSSLLQLFPSIPARI